MRCPKCGSNIDNGLGACPVCGRAISDAENAAVFQLELGGRISSILDEKNTSEGGVGGMSLGDFYEEGEEPVSNTLRFEKPDTVFPHISEEDRRRAALIARKQRESIENQYHWDSTLDWESLDSAVSSAAGIQSQNIRSSNAGSANRSNAPAARRRVVSYGQEDVTAFSSSRNGNASGKAAPQSPQRTSQSAARSASGASGASKTRSASGASGTSSKARNASASGSGASKSRNTSASGSGASKSRNTSASGSGASKSRNTSASGSGSKRSAASGSAASKARAAAASRTGSSSSSREKRYYDEERSAERSYEYEDDDDFFAGSSRMRKPKKKKASSGNFAVFIVVLAVLLVIAAIIFFVVRSNVGSGGNETETETTTPAETKYTGEEVIICNVEDGGSYALPLSITIESSGGNRIYYTLDGTTPSVSSYRYTSPIEISEKDISGNTANYVLKVVTYTQTSIKKAEYSASFTVYVGDLAAPQFSLPEGTYTSNQGITITADKGTTIYYTYDEDGTEPTEDSDVYRGTIAMKSGTNILSAIAVKDGLVSGVSRITYTLDPNAETEEETDSGSDEEEGGEINISNNEAEDIVTERLENAGYTVSTDSEEYEERAGIENLGLIVSDGRSYYIFRANIYVGDKLDDYWFYGVDADTGDIYHASMEDDGTFSVSR